MAIATRASDVNLCLPTRSLDGAADTAVRGYSDTQLAVWNEVKGAMAKIDTTGVDENTSPISTEVCTVHYSKWLVKFIMLEVARQKEITAETADCSRKSVFQSCRSESV
jgi:hypothetical protein